MKIIAIVAAGVIALFVAAFYWLGQAPDASRAAMIDAPPEAAPTVSKSPSTGTDGTVAAAKVAVDRALPSASAGASTSAVAPIVTVRATSPLSDKDRRKQVTLTRINEFESGRGWRALVDRALTNPAAMDAEERYLAARAMDICEAQRNRQRNVAQEREDFVRTIPAGDQFREQRVNAFSQVTTDPCTQLAGTSYSRDQINQLLRDGRAAGEPKSAVLVVEKEIHANPQQARSSGLTNEQRSTLRDAVSTLDPASIRRTGEIMMATQTGWQNTFGPNAEKVEPWLVSAAWRLVACDNGMPCGPESQSVLSACAYNGRCNATSQDQLLQMYDLGSQRYQEVQRYRAIIAQAIAEGRWAWIGLGG